MSARKILAMIIALMMIFSLSACEGSQQPEQTVQTYEQFGSEFGAFVLVERYQIKISSRSYYQYILYDPDTMVMYTCIAENSSHSCAPTITVMYNADGTLKLYK